MAVPIRVQLHPQCVRQIISVTPTYLLSGITVCRITSQGTEIFKVTAVEKKSHMAHTYAAGTSMRVNLSRQRDCRDGGGRVGGNCKLRITWRSTTVNMAQNCPYALTKLCLPCETQCRSPPLHPPGHTTQQCALSTT